MKRLVREPASGRPINHKRVAIAPSDCPPSDSVVWSTPVRERGPSFSSFWLWLLTGILSGFFPSLATRPHSFPFLLFAVPMAVQVFVVACLFLETRGKALE